MAITFGDTSEHLLRGFDRIVASVVDALPRRKALPTPRSWQAERGTLIAYARVRVAGGFPGSIRLQQALPKTTLHLTDQWLIVGEGTANGFALPVDCIHGCSVQFAGGLLPPHLVIWYRDGAAIGSFALEFANSARGRTGTFRAESWQDLLATLDVPSIATAMAEFHPEVHLDWNCIDELTREEMLFSGPALASSGGRFGEVLDTADVWITDRWLLWCPHHGTALNHLPLDHLIECRNGFGDRLAISIEDACGGRYDFFFDFGIDDSGERTQTGARVQAILAAVGVPAGTSTPPYAPWRRGGTRPPVEM